jgi:tetratricopeptide (TPR) repeat protein
MLKRLSAFLLVAVLCSCHSSDGPAVGPQYADSLIAHYSANSMVEDNLSFWQSRMKAHPDNFVNGPEYASALISAFRQNGDIRQLVKADSLVNKSNEANAGKEPAVWRSLAGLAMLRHQFSLPADFLKQAVAIEGNSFPNAFLDFDISFERGNYYHAKALLNALKAGNEYGYLFRRSKYEHYEGSLDSAIACMRMAAEKAGNIKNLKQLALSNAADLYMHKGDVLSAVDLYDQALLLNPCDLHSITGLGWIALVHDGNDSLAERMFQFVHSQTKSPDILLKLSQMEGYRGNKERQQEYAMAFIKETSDPAYGKMYNKYLIDLYTGIIPDAGKAVKLAQQEVDDRPTPQTLAWYAWSLYCNREIDKALRIYKGFVSGKPLEAQELYYMGKMMQGLEKSFNAHEFFTAAWKNKYDLDPQKQSAIRQALDQ